MRGDPARLTEVQLSRRCAEVHSLLRTAPPFIYIALYFSLPLAIVPASDDPRCELPHPNSHTKWRHHLRCDETTWLQGEG